MNPSDNKEDEVISVNMSRKDYQILRDMIERERAYTWLQSRVRSFWLWVVVGGLLATVTLGERLLTFLNPGVIK